MKKIVSKLFSGATDSLSYLKETKDFLLGNRCTIRFNIFYGIVIFS